MNYNACDNSNPKPALTEFAFGHACAGIFGYSHAFGGYAGSHASLIRVPYADLNCFVVPEGVSDEQAVFVSDAAPTGFFGVDMAGIEPGDIVAVWWCGGVGQMAIRSAYLLGASRVIAIERYPDRLAMAAEKGGAEVLNYEEVDIHEALAEMTGGRGPDRCIDCVGLEAHGVDPGFVLDAANQQAFMTSDRASALRQAIMACRKGGTVSVVGVYAFTDKFPMGAIVNKALTLRSGQQPGQRYAKRLFDLILKGEPDISYLLTHPMGLEDSPQGYALFKNKSEACMRAVFRP